MDSSRGHHPTVPNAEPGKSLQAALLIGVGVMAAVDEIVFHQLLRWHHFIDLSTPAFGLISDGLLHAAELLAIVGGFFWLAALRRDGVFVPGRGWAGFFLGAGGFQLFDGIIDHKLLRLHQIRYDVDNLLLYDLSWNLGALVLLAIGFWLLRRHRAQDTLDPRDARDARDARVAGREPPP